MVEEGEVVAVAGGRFSSFRCREEGELVGGEEEGKQAGALYVRLWK